LYLTHFAYYKENVYTWSPFQGNFSPARETYSGEKARNPHSLLWGEMASGGLGAAAPIMAFSLESPLAYQTDKLTK